MKDMNNPSRRRWISGVGASAVAATTMLASPPALSISSDQWDHEVDVLCIGSGAAACTAAIVATGEGGSAMIVEKMPLIGGTTGKSGGIAWIPNNFLLQSKGVVDTKEDCLRYMARYAFPARYNIAAPFMGLEESDFRLMEAIYNHGSMAVARLQELDAVHFEEFKLFYVDRPAPDYGDTLPENKVPTGRALQPKGAGLGAGRILIERMEAWLVAKKVPILTDTRVTRIVLEGGRVIGVEAEQDGKILRLRARRGVVFGTGGFAHNTELISLHQPPIFGSCASPSSTGDLIPMAAEIGAQMGNLRTAWRAQVVLEEALQSRAIAYVTFGLPGDSMVMLNRYGQRVVNEKANYHDRTQVHFHYDARRKEYPNHLLFLIFDHHSYDAFGGDYPFPDVKQGSPFLVQGDNLESLATKLDERLKKLSSKTGGVSLAPDFLDGAKGTIRRFNDYARKGIDPEFGRGAREYDKEWHDFYSPRRPGTKVPPSAMPNRTLHPLAVDGPVYAIILGSGALDTNAGPRINTAAQMLDSRGRPIQGLYGAGNCVASPSREAYYAAGGTIGSAITFAYLAAKHAMGSQK